MAAANVSLSVGRTSTARQETFVSALEQLMRRNGLRPQTVGRTSFSVDQPLVKGRAAAVPTAVETAD
jgi:hypothetical protein